MKRNSPKLSDRLYAIAANQSGYFTAQEALGAGYSKRLQHYHRQRGHWLAIGRGLFRLRHFPHSTWENYVQWSLWSRNQKGETQATLSHETAALFHELGDFLPAKIHFTVPPSFRKSVPKGLVLHKGILTAQEIQVLGGFRVTTPLKTIRDLQQNHAEPDHLRSAVKDAVRRGIITLVERKQLKL